MDVRRSSVALWSGVLAGPFAFAIDLQLRYALIPWACARGSRWILTVISIPLLLVAMTGALISWRGLHIEDGDVARIRFMAVSGLMLSMFFALAIVAATIPDFFLHPCD